MHRNKKQQQQQTEQRFQLHHSSSRSKHVKRNMRLSAKFRPSPYPTPIHYERKTWYSSKIYHIYKFTSIRRQAAQKFKLRYSKYRGRQRSGIDTIRYHTKGEGHSRRSKLRHFSLGSFFSYFRSDWSDS